MSKKQGTLWGSTPINAQMFKKYLPTLMLEIIHPYYINTDTALSVYRIYTN